MQPIIKSSSARLSRRSCRRRRSALRPRPPGRHPRRSLRGTSPETPRLTSPGGPHHRQDAGGLGRGGSQRSQHLKSDSGGNGTDGAETEAGGEQVASGRRHARRAGRVGGGEKFLLNFPTRSRRGRGAAAPSGAGGRAPGPTLPGRGRPPPPAGPRPVLTCPPVVLAWVAAPGAPGWGGGGGRRRGPRGPLPPSTSWSRRPAAATTALSTPDLLLRKEGIPGLPPLALPLHRRSARRPPRSWRRPSAGAGRGLQPPARGRPRPELAPRPPGSRGPDLPAPTRSPAGRRPVPPRASRVASRSHGSRPNMAAGSEADSRGGAGGVKGRLCARGQPVAPETEPGTQSPSPKPLSWPSPGCLRCGLRGFVWGGTGRAEGLGGW